MSSVSISASDELNILPSKTSSQNDFDFLEGNWNVHNKKLKSRLTNSSEWIEFDAVQEMRKVLGGIGNIDNMYVTIDGKPYEGMSIRLFNPSTKLWSIYWADNNSGVMDKPVIGSFDGETGSFFCRDQFKGQEIIMQFQWDISNPHQPVWNQAFSADNGKTWEWNWYMYFTKKEKNVATITQGINVLELRNYLVKPGQRENFIDYFEDHFIRSQNESGGFILGQFRIKEEDDRFFWIRGFSDMKSRVKFLNDFYNGPVWKEHRNVPNSMLLNNDNVHLLKPVHSSDSALPAEGFNMDWFGKQKGMVVIDYYISNGKRDKLLKFFQDTYLPFQKAFGIEDVSLWVSEEAPNDFPPLPVFQDKNLLVSIAFYKDEVDYQSKMKLADSNLKEDLRYQMADLVTERSTVVLYPTQKSFSAVK